MTPCIYTDLVQVGIKFTSVVGDYVVRVRTHNYSNPGGLLVDSTCCDLSCGVPSCDNVFYYCLRTLDTSDGDRECRDEKRNLVNYNDEPLDFSQPNVLGLFNPLPLQGLKKEWAVSYNIRATLYYILLQCTVDLEISVY